MTNNINPFGSGYPFTPQYYAVDEHGQRLIPPANYMPAVPQFSPHRPELMHTNFLGHDDPSRTMLPGAQGSARVRRRVGASGEQVKFRRTRSGCYTCRNRRVKVCPRPPFAMTTNTADVCLVYSVMKRTRHVSVSSHHDRLLLQCLILNTVIRLPQRRQGLYLPRAILIQQTQTRQLERQGR